MEVQAETVRRLLAIVDAGLVDGLGEPIPGQMCIEAAIAHAFGEPHSDEPSCVAPAVRAAAIPLNDAPWSSPQARAAGLRRMGVAGLGSAGVIDDVAFAERLAQLTIREIVPMALRAAAWAMAVADLPWAPLVQAAHRCAEEGDPAAAWDAWDAAWDAWDAAWDARAAAMAARDARAAALAAGDAARAAWAAGDAARAARDAGDGVLRHAAEIQVRVLTELGSPGVAWLGLCEEVAP